MDRDNCETDERDWKRKEVEKKRVKGHIEPL